MSAIALMFTRTQQGFGSIFSMLRRFPTMLLERPTLRASVWTVTGFGASQVIRFGSNLILTRLLVPEVFGLMAIANSLILGLSLFSDIGTHRSIIQNPRGEEKKFLDTAWTVQMIRGGVLYILCALAAFPMNHFYGKEGDNTLLWLIPALAFTTLSWGACSTALVTLNRRMEVGKLMIFEFSAQVISLLFVLPLVFYMRSIHALVIGMICGETIRVIASHLILPGYRNRFAWDKEAVHDIISFGKWLMLSSAMTFLATQSDRLILGHYFTLTFIGIYMVGWALAEVPRQVLKKLNHTVLMPQCCRQLHLEREELRKLIMRHRKMLLLVAAGGISVLTAWGDYAIIFLFDDRYDVGAWILPVMASGLWVSTLALTSDPALFALGKPRIPSFGNMAKFIYMIIAIPVLSHYVGPLGAMLVIAWSDILYYVAVAIGLSRQKLSVLKQDLTYTMVMIPALALMLLVRYLLGLGTPLDTFFQAGDALTEWLR